jgi:hypothetical protein
LVFLCFLFFATARLPAAEPADVEALVQGGATELAAALVNQEQTGALPPERWAAWERARLEVYAARHEWDELARRVEALPEDLPIGFRREAWLRAGQARLAARDPEGARRFLRRLIWTAGDSPPDEKWREALAQARRFVIRSYLLEDALADALAALRRYQQDYPAAKEEPWQRLHAEILLRAGEPRAAFEVLAGQQSYESRWLRLAAGLRAGYYTPREVYERAVRLAAARESSPPLSRQVWLLAAEAAQRGNDEVGYVRALEQALALPEGGEGAGVLAAADPDRLWHAYERLAETLGNAARLLVGDDEKWLAKAASYGEPIDVHARALYAFLAHAGRKPDARRTAHERLAEGLAAAGLTETLKALYLRSARYARPEAVPEPVRYRLADIAMAEYDIRLAAALIKGLTRPPEEKEDPALWRLRRSRILVYAGETGPALEIMHALLEEREVVDDEFAGRFLQVVFDLQTAGHHEAAIELLDSLYARADNARMRRELLFWLADSHAAVGRHREAAELYLRSAVYGGASGNDPWGQTARYHAAGALARAGFYQDARSVYLGLLRVTADKRRRLEIERRIQELWLERQKATLP